MAARLRGIVALGAAAMLLAGCSAAPAPRPAETQVGVCHSDANRPANVYSASMIDGIYRPGAERGEADAQYHLANALLLGAGVPRDDGMAARWYRSAADQGHPGALYYLAALTETGRGVDRDTTQAFALYRQAAEAGDLRAPECMGLYYAGLAGKGPVDPVEAAMWFEIATQSRIVEPANYRALKATMSEAQLAEARRRAGAWRPDPGNYEATAPAAGGVATRAGSGVILSLRGDVLTNAHVVVGCRSLRLIDEAGTDAAATAAAFDLGDDLALLASTLRPRAAAALPPAGDNDRGAAVLVAGYPRADLLGVGGAMTTGGLISDVAGPQGDPRFLRMTAPIADGNSGGAVLDRGGNLAGIVIGRSSETRLASLGGDLPPGLSFAIKASQIRRFLAANGRADLAGGVPPPPATSAADLAAIGRAVTVYVECRD